MIRKVPRKYFKILDWVNKNIRKNEKSIFLYSNLGFRDNVKAMYDFFIKDIRFKDYKIICSLNNYRKYKDNAPDNVMFVGNIRGIFYFFKAKFCFYCFGKYPINPSKKQVVVNLWHGMPLKTIGNMQKDCEDIKYNYFTYVLATSDFYKEIMTKSFNCDEKQVMVCGQPRNDEIFLNNRNAMNKLINNCQSEVVSENQISLKDVSKIIVWLPTYRDSSDNSKLPIISRDGLDVINDRLAANSSVMFIKPHPLADLNYASYSVYSNIFICDQKKLDELGMSVYTMLSVSDALITDYSSVYFDYLLLDRTIGFTVEDMGKYKEDRGFVFDNPEEYMPGMKIQNQADMVTFVNYLVDGKDEYKQQRKRINDIVNYYKDGKNCERICKKIGLLKQGEL